jgi:hypothetical protein
MVGFEQVTLTPVFFLIETADNVSPRSTEAAHRVRRSAARAATHCQNQTSRQHLLKLIYFWTFMP